MNVLALPLSVHPIHHGDVYRGTDRIEHYHADDRAFAVRDANGIVLAVRNTKLKADALRLALSKEQAANDIDDARAQRELREMA